MEKEIKMDKAHTSTAKVVEDGKLKVQSSQGEGKRENPKMTNTKKGVVSAQDWDKGTTGASQSDKAAKVLVYLEGLEKGAGAFMPAIAAGTGLKWPYSTVKALVKSGAVQEKKLGKALAYRAKPSKVGQ